MPDDVSMVLNNAQVFVVYADGRLAVGTGRLVRSIREGDEGFRVYTTRPGGSVVEVDVRLRDTTPEHRHYGLFVKGSSGPPVGGVVIDKLPEQTPRQPAF